MPGLPARVSIRAMVDETQAEGGSAASICPWCSASYTGSPENCPSCGATLSGDVVPDGSLPGLTAIDAAAIVRAKQSIPRPRSRILSWISGEYPDEEGSPAEAGALAPPDPEVRREILRLELEAEVARAEGKLANEKFVANAPNDVVEAERGKLDRYRAELAELSG